MLQVGATGMNNNNNYNLIWELGPKLEFQKLKRTYADVCIILFLTN
jgi:hypothetical protein